MGRNAVLGADIKTDSGLANCGDHEPRRCMIIATISAASAAKTVLTKLTASLPIFPAFSRVAPMMLSRNIPPMPAKATIGVQRQSNRPAIALTQATRLAAIHPPIVPSTLIAPLVPIGTSRKSVIKYAPRAVAWPNSLETVSAAASAMAAIEATSRRSASSGSQIAGSAHAVAAPRLAITCEAVRPRRRSATPSRCLREYPQRVEINVSKNSINKGINPAKPPASIRTNATSTPAMAPPSLTEPMKRATRANPIATTAAGKPLKWMRFVTVSSVSHALMGCDGAPVPGCGQNAANCSTTRIPPNGTALGPAPADLCGIRLDEARWSTGLYCAHFCSSCCPIFRPITDVEKWVKRWPEKDELWHLPCGLDT